MATKTRADLKTLFQQGDTLLQSSFEDLIDTMLAEGGNTGSLNDACQTSSGSATAAGAWQIGAGTNADGTSLQVGDVENHRGIRLHGHTSLGTSWGPSNGDFWVDGGYVLFHSFGTTFYAGEWEGLY
jgi:hypothetical protein